jgi:glycosyl transferase family 25
MAFISESAVSNFDAPLRGARAVDFFDKTEIPVFLINRDKDRDRLEHMEQLARAHDIVFERVKAVEGFDVPESLRKQFFDESMKPLSNLLPGEVGCYASHLMCCRMILERDLDVALVLEDDVELNDGFMALVERIARSSTQDWDIVRLSSPPKGPVVPLENLSYGYHLVKYSSLPKLTGAQLWTREGARKFLKFRERVRPVDADLRYGWEYDLITLGVFPPLASQGDAFPSSINGDTAKRRVLRGGRWKKITLRSRLHGLWHRASHLGLRDFVGCLALLFSRRPEDIYRRGSKVRAKCLCGLQRLIYAASMYLFMTAEILG